MASMTKEISTLFSVFFTSILFLAGCSNSSSNIGSKNMACAFVEGYLDNKAFALKDLAEGGSAKESVDYFLSPLLKEFDADLDSKVLFGDFFEAMISWGSSVDFAHAQNNSAAITNATVVLESEMDQFAIRCENFGWKFEKDYRL
ncbi:hypothetical protein A1sIA79_00640 [Candidatus Planktophila versatilis]|uniref:Lipoprotein n=2 Tax=Candidatus Planktophila versatilis TaxID=1884905 RepID=A0ABN5BG45_9ACTN|nr:hypothetical protein A1sIA79_00640 [Candidatus Planktophila versatilis]